MPRILRNFLKVEERDVAARSDQSLPAAHAVSVSTVARIGCRHSVSHAPPGGSEKYDVDEVKSDLKLRPGPFRSAPQSPWLLTLLGCRRSGLQVA
jgi:hypothetical protein